MKYAIRIHPFLFFLAIQLSSSYDLIIPEGDRSNLIENFHWSLE